MYLSLLEKKLRDGSLAVKFPDGTQRRFGTGAPHAEWRLHSRSALGRIARDPELALGETYVEGAWDAGEGGLRTLLGVLMRNFPDEPERGLRRVLYAPLAWLRSLNRIASSRRNVAHHYDLDEWLFRLFLDEDLQYSCAYYEREDMSLDEAQRAKCRHIAHKLLLRPGQRVLDIGCGWGGMALYLAETADVEVTGLTLSREQLRVARQRAQERGLADRVRFELQDYREHHGRYDRIVSVGMFEHVGTPNHVRYFDQVRRLLTDEGIALVHTIGCFAPFSRTNAWIRRYIFPGGAIPSLNEVTHATGNAGLVTTDLEVLRLHYARTLAEWLRRFRAHREEIVAQMGERFYRTWEFYLASCEAAFHWRGLAVFQVQLARSIDAVPLTRNYLYTDSLPN